MRTFIFIPPVRRAAGGITVLLQIAEILHGAGREVFLVPREFVGGRDAGIGGWRPEGVGADVPCVPFDNPGLAPGDLWLVPEGWVNSLAPGLNAGARCMSYVQNWAYLFSSLPPEVTWNSLPVEFLAVSDPVARYVTEMTRREAPIVRPGIDPERFFAPEKKPGGMITVAAMPRKNKALLAQIKSAFVSRNGSDAVLFVDIEGKDADGVARALRRSHIFLATGYPEGCPLPPLEAMASGCLCVGFSGYGGWDYMRQAQDRPRFTPWWPLRQVPWGGNGLWCADADVFDAALSLEQAVDWIRNGSDKATRAVANARATAASYSPEAQRQEVLDTWARLEAM